MQLDLLTCWTNYQLTLDPFKLGPLQAKARLCLEIIAGFQMSGKYNTLWVEYDFHNPIVFLG